MNELKIGIIDADLLDNGTRHPNLALMKISGYYKAQGHIVKLLNNYEKLEEYNTVFALELLTELDEAYEQIDRDKLDQLFRG